MTNKLKSNWMGHSSAAPTLYRAASKGKVFTRTEKIKIINARKAREAKMNEIKTFIAEEKAKVKAAKEKRERFFQGLKVLVENPDAKIRKGNDRIYIQPRINGAFGKAITL